MPYSGSPRLTADLIPENTAEKKTAASTKSTSGKSDGGVAGDQSHAVNANASAVLANDAGSTDAGAATFVADRRRGLTLAELPYSGKERAHALGVM